jgi:hypothetical protein
VVVHAEKKEPHDAALFMFTRAFLRDATAARCRPPLAIQSLALEEASCRTGFGQSLRLASGC